MYDFLREQKLSAKFNRIFPEGNGKANQEYLINDKKYLEDMKKFFTLWLYDNKADAFSTFDIYLSALFGLKHRECIFSGCLFKWIAVAPDGTVFPCPRFGNSGYSLGNIKDIENIYYVYRCGSHGKECLSRAINVIYMDEYITSLIGSCLLYPDNREKLIELVKVSYIKANDKLNEELNCFETELKEMVETLENRKQEIGRQQNKQLQSYLADEISELTLKKDDLQRNIYDTRQKIKDFPEFKPSDIRKRAQLLYNLLESDSLEDKQYVINKFIAVIEVDNDNIETTIDLQSLTTTYIPIQTTVIEKRDNVARAENFYRRSLSFPTLHIQVR